MLEVQREVGSGVGALAALLPRQAEDGLREPAFGEEPLDELGEEGVRPAEVRPRVVAGVPHLPPPRHTPPPRRTPPLEAGWCARH